MEPLKEDRDEQAAAGVCTPSDPAYTKSGEQSHTAPTLGPRQRSEEAQQLRKQLRTASRPRWKRRVKDRHLAHVQEVLKRVPGRAVIYQPLAPPGLEEMTSQNLWESVWREQVPEACDPACGGRLCGEKQGRGRTATTRDTLTSVTPRAQRKRWQVSPGFDPPPPLPTPPPAPSPHPTTMLGFSQTTTRTVPVITATSHSSSPTGSELCDGPARPSQRLGGGAGRVARRLHCSGLWLRQWEPGAGPRCPLPSVPLHWH